MPDEKPLRADARRNRARILEVAEAVFAARGASASTEEIAREAGVGIGTVFRHFPTKEDLMEAVFVAHVRRLAAEADELTTADDPGEALFSFIARAVEGAPAKLAFVEALAAVGINVKGAGTRARRDMLQPLGTLLTRAQQAGAVRADVRLAELDALIVGTSRALIHAGSDTEVQRRTLAVVFDGLRRP